MRRQGPYFCLGASYGPIEVIDPKLAILARVSLFLLIGLIILNVVLAAGHNPNRLDLSHIALISSLPLILLSPKRLHLLKNLDWSTLLFFASMFVLMASVWQSGILQNLINHWHIDLNSVPVILSLSATISQLIPNVPLVALYLPLLTHPDPAKLMALAAGSNVIIIQHAEKHGATLGFIEFARAGIPLSVLNLLIYWVWFRYGFN